MENSRAATHRLGVTRSEFFVFHDTGLHPGIHGELVANHAPVRHRAVCPFFVKLRKAKIERFQDCVLTGKSTFLCHLPKAGIHRLNRVRGVHDLPNGAAIIEKLLLMDPVSDPHVYRSGILAPGLLESLKFCFCRPEAWGTVDLLELCGISLVVF